jgi:predicted aldo/keto reductase-like oxidoreductase
MVYRELGRTGFKVSEVGLGGEYLEGKRLGQVKSVMDAAIDNGINILDCFMSNPSVRSNLGQCLKGRREKMHIQGHFRSIWNDGQYQRTLDIKQVKLFFEDLLARFGTDYLDIGTLHLIDNAGDFDEIFNGPILEYALRQKEKGVIRALGVSTHNPVQALKAAKTGLVDTILFSINPAYDVMDENAARPKKLDNAFFNDLGSLNCINSVRQELYAYCASHNIGITVMKALAAGALLDERTSPFGKALTTQQCIHYALTRPGVASVLLGMQTVEQVEDCLGYETASAEERDYSFIYSQSSRFSMDGKCMYCNHCLPCTAHIDIAQVGKYLDMALLDGKPSPSLREHYMALEHRADECLGCGICETQCPFNVRIVERMKQASELFS